MQEHAGHDHDQHEHAGHDDGHAGHDHSVHAAQFRDRFWWSLVLAVPIVVFSEMFSDLLGYDRPSGTAWVSPVPTT